MAKRDIMAGLIFILLGLFIGSMSLGLGYKAEYGPGPGFMPFWLSVILIGCSIAMIIPAFKSLRAGSEPIAKDQLLFTKPLVVFVALGSLLFVAILLEAAGFIISAAIAITFYVKLVKPDFIWTRSAAFGLRRQY
jgi:hypothetical protein